MSKLKLVFLMFAIMIASFTFAQREVGQIIATDPENDELIFTLIEQTPAEAFAMTGNGMLYVSDESQLSIGMHTVYTRVKEIYTPELYEAYANMYIQVYNTDTTSPGFIECDTTIWWDISEDISYEWQYTDSIPTAYIYTDSTELEIITIDSLMYYIVPTCVPGDTILVDEL